MSHSTFSRPLALAAFPIGSGLLLGCAGGAGDGVAAGKPRFEPAALVPIASESPPRLIVDSPLTDQLALGRVVIRYRAEHMRILPVYGEAALDVSPRIGHVHVTVDDGPWRWVDASGEPLIVNKLPPGPHKILLELVDPMHRTVDSATVRFEVPQRPTS